MHNKEVKRNVIFLYAFNCNGFYLYLFSLMNPVIDNLFRSMETLLTHVAFRNNILTQDIDMFPCKYHVRYRYNR